MASGDVMTRDKGTEEVQCRGRDWSVHRGCFHLGNVGSDHIATLIKSSPKVGGFGDGMGEAAGGAGDGDRLDRRSPEYFYVWMHSTTSFNMLKLQSSNALDQMEASDLYSFQHAQAALKHKTELKVSDLDSFQHAQIAIKHITDLKFYRASETMLFLTLPDVDVRRTY